MDTLHGAIVTYLGRISQTNLTERQTELLSDYMAITNYIESIGDMVETNIVDCGLERHRAARSSVSYVTHSVLGGVAREGPLVGRAGGGIGRELGSGRWPKSVIDAKQDVARLARCDGTPSRPATHRARRAIAWHSSVSSRR